MVILGAFGTVWDTLGNLGSKIVGIIFCGLRLGNDKNRQWLGPTDRAVSRAMVSNVDYLIGHGCKKAGTNIRYFQRSTARKLQNMTGWGNNKDWYF